MKKYLILFIALISIAATPPSRQVIYQSGSTIRSADVTANEDEIFGYLQTGVSKVSVDCTSNANGGALTTDADGTLVCTDDDNSGTGGGGEGTITAVGNCTSGDCFAATGNYTLMWEGTTEDEFEATLTAGDPVVDTDFVFPTTVGGTIAVTNGSLGTGCAEFSNGQLIDSGSPCLEDGGGDFSGPVDSIDNEIVVFDGTGGKTGKRSGAYVDTSGNITATSFIATGVGQSIVEQGFISNNSQCATASCNTIINGDTLAIMSVDTSTDTITGLGSWIMTNANFQLPNSITLNNTNCDESSEAGRIYVDNNAASGQQLYVCEGTTGWVLQSGGGGGGASSLTGLSDVNSATTTAGNILIADGGDQFNSFSVNGDVTLNSIGNVQLVADTVTAADIADINSTTATAGNILVGNGQGFDSVATSGDVTVAKDGVTAIGSSKVTSTMIVDDTITASDIAGINSLTATANNVLVGDGTGFNSAVLSQLTGDALNLAPASQPGMVMQTSTSGDTDGWMAVINDGDGVSDDPLKFGSGTTKGNNSFFSMTSTEVYTPQSVNGGHALMGVENTISTSGSTDELATFEMKHNAQPAVYLSAGKEEDFTSAGNQSSFFSVSTSDDGTLSEKLRITSDGLVGVGMTGPIVKMDVDGAGRFNGGAAQSQTNAGLLINASESSANFTGSFQVKGGTELGLIYTDPSVDMVGFFTTAPTSGVMIDTSFSLPITTKTTDYTITANDSTILCDATGQTVQVYLPAATGITGRIYNIKKVDTSSNSCAIVAASGDRVDMDTYLTTNVSFTNKQVQSDGTYYWWSL